VPRCIAVYVHLYSTHNLSAKDSFKPIIVTVVCGGLTSIHAAADSIDTGEVRRGGGIVKLKNPMLWVVEVVT